MLRDVCFVKGEQPQINILMRKNMKGSNKRVTKFEL